MYIHGLQKDGVKPAKNQLQININRGSTLKRTISRAYTKKRDRKE